MGREDDGGSLDDGAPSDAGSWETVDDNEMDLADDSVNVLSAARLVIFWVQSFLSKHLLGSFYSLYLLIAAIFFRMIHKI